MNLWWVEHENVEVTFHRGDCGLKFVTGSHECCLKVENCTNFAYTVGHQGQYMIWIEHYKCWNDMASCSAGF